MNVVPFRLLPATIVALAALLGAKSIELVWAAVPVRTSQPISAASPATTIPPENVQPNPASDIERGLLQELQRRRTQLDQRETAVEQREATLVAAEEKLNQRIHELQHLQQQLRATLVERKQRTDAAWISLVTLYEAMKPRDAAAILNDLDMPVLVELTARMNERKAAAIMAAMQPDRARDLTAELAEVRDSEP
jgi:flagellar motility protein MotE (MotC chaperone)